MLAIVSTLTLALAATGCSSNSIQGRAANAGISAGLTLGTCTAFALAAPACMVVGFAAGEVVGRVGSLDDPRL